MPRHLTVAIALAAGMASLAAQGSDDSSTFDAIEPLVTEAINRNDLPGAVMRR